jgi:nucleoside-diphosphate-sugar epimerase
MRFMNILIIGGTRNIGYYLTQRLYHGGHRVTLLNRGISRDDLPQDIPRLRCDRTDANQLKRALTGRSFDVVVDTVLYKGAEAETIAQLLAGHVGHYLFLSTGQVYLVREGITRPFKESDYEGHLLPMPEPITYDHEEWVYGMEKRQAEDALKQAYEKDNFPYTSLRLPMVNSERDTFYRLYSYLLRIKDGGPILVPDAPNHPLRHIYAHDVVNALMSLIETGKGKGQAYNISQNETLALDEFLDIVGEVISVEPHIVRVERDLLEANGFLPDCSPFSDVWMSELDNTLSKNELGIEYTPVKTYIEKIVAHYRAHPPAHPVSYRRRQSEKNLVTT